jgi:DDE superfamily endonuclease
MTASGVGRLHVVDGTMNAEKYIKVLENDMMPSAKNLFSGSYFFQDDNAPCHRAKVVVNFKMISGVQTIDWPAQSPDLNPIENLWSRISVEVAKKQPRTKKELIESVASIWEKEITQEHLAKLVHSMPNRCRLVLRNKGWPIKY